MIRLATRRSSFTVGPERRWTEADAFVDGGGYLYWLDPVSGAYARPVGHALESRVDAVKSLSREGEAALRGVSPND
jgi:hypothetical protein